jgi:hypothetical protein
MTVDQNIQGWFGGRVVTMVSVVVLSLACSGPLDTGATGMGRTKGKPAADGTCAAGQSICGVAAFARCADLQTDPAHCGACDRTCLPGIACQAGACQQTACANSTSSTYSGKPNTSGSSYGAFTGQIFADVNGDAIQDLVEWKVDFQNQRAFRVSLGQGGGAFGAAETYQLGLAVLDIHVGNDNDDGLDDLFVFTEQDAGLGPVQVEVWLGQRDGHLLRARVNDLPGASLNGLDGLAVGDLSGDGWADAVVSSGDQRNVSVFLSDSTGTLHLTQTLRVGGSGVNVIRVNDWNRDGLPDLIVMNGASLAILYNRGDGSFEQPMACPAFLPTVGGVTPVIEDFNHDGLVDFAFNGNPVRVVLRQSECGFSPLSIYDVPVPKSVPQAMGDQVARGGVPILRAADMNGDGQLDLVLTFDLLYGRVIYPGDPVSSGDEGVAGDTYLSVLLGKPDGTFQLQDTVISLGPVNITDLAIGESTGDKRPDIVATSSDGQTRVWENTCQ